MKNRRWTLKGWEIGLQIYNEKYFYKIFRMDPFFIRFLKIAMLKY